jgi:hypothetical protein
VKAFEVRPLAPPFRQGAHLLQEGEDVGHLSFVEAAGEQLPGAFKHLPGAPALPPDDLPYGFLPDLPDSRCQ